MKYTLESSRQFYNSQPGKRASAAMIMRRDGKYLMIKHDYKDVMTFPSGLNDPNESPKTTAIREAKEEVGLDLTSDAVSFYAVTYIGEQYGFKDRFHFFFVTDINDQQLASLVFEEGIEHHEWTEVDRIAELAGNRAVYTTIERMLKTGESGSYFESVFSTRES
jgi:8-oxo-dGTP pyrophosphatase MutT (NUDIX family)